MVQNSSCIERKTVGIMEQEVRLYQFFKLLNECIYNSQENIDYSYMLEQAIILYFYTVPLHECYKSKQWSLGLILEY